MGVSAPMSKIQTQGCAEPPSYPRQVEQRGCLCTKRGADAWLLMWFPGLWVIAVHHLLSFGDSSQSACLGLESALYLFWIISCIPFFGFGTLKWRPPALVPNCCPPASRIQLGARNLLWLLLWRLAYSPLWDSCPDREVLGTYIIPYYIIL